MSAVMSPRRSRRPRRAHAAGSGGQSALFGAGSAPAAVAHAAPGEAAGASAPAAATAAPAAPVAAQTARAVPVGVPAAHPVAAVAPAAGSAPTASARRHGPTLEALVAGAWEGLLAGAPADCMVCGAPLVPRHSAGAGIVGGRCGGCGTTVS